MKVSDGFKSIRAYFEVAVQAVRGVTKDSKQDAILDAAETWMNALRDEPVKGTAFPVQGMYFEGNAKVCTEGTVLNPKDKKSLVYAAWRKSSVCCHNLISLTTGGADNRFRETCKAYCVGCENASIESCLRELNASIDSVFGKGGAFDKAIEKAEKDDWKAQ